MRCVINTNMRQNRITTNSNYAHFALADIFQSRAVANVRIHLNWAQTPYFLRQDFARAVAKRFRNNISRFYFPDARDGHLAVCVIHLHDKEFPHLHILVEIPPHKSIKDVQEFVRRFVCKPSRDEMKRQVWDCIPAKYQDTLFYAEEVNDLIGSLIYNQRYGLETALIF